MVVELRCKIQYPRLERKAFYSLFFSLLFSFMPDSRWGRSTFGVNLYILDVDERFCSFYYIPHNLYDNVKKS